MNWMGLIVWRSVHLLGVFSCCCFPVLGSETGEAVESCVLEQQGSIQGRVTDQGNPVPDGVGIVVIFEGGPVQATGTLAGRYSLPLLARRCGQELTWIGFQLRDPEGGQWLTPTQAELTVDLSLNTLPPTPVTPESDCKLVVGEIEGEVEIDGRPAPDGTVVIATTETESDPQTQQVVTRGGRYQLASVGLQCANGQERFFPIQIETQDHLIKVLPASRSEKQDLTC